MNKIIFLIFVALVDLPSSLTWGASPSDDCSPKMANLEVSPLAEAFSDAYKTPDLYRPRQCGLNVKNLISFLRSRDVNLRGARVLFILHENVKMMGAGGPTSRGKLTPTHNRSNAPVWDFHVILTLPESVRKNIILDLDTASKPVLSDDYFSDLFPNGESGDDRLANIFVSQISVSNFLKAFSDLQNGESSTQAMNENQAVANLMKNKVNALPTISLRAYLQMH